jgi:hypothetical protein
MAASFAAADWPASASGCTTISERTADGLSAHTTSTRFCWTLTSSMPASASAAAHCSPCAARAREA